MNNVFNLNMTLLINKQKINFLIISLGSFIGSIIFLNLINFFTQDPTLSSKLTVVLIFFYNFYFLKRSFKIKENNNLFILLIILSAIFRFFEYWIFLNLFNYIYNINYAWIITILLSFMIKYFLYPYTLNKLKKK